jgi:hypothetical protein
MSYRSAMSRPCVVWRRVDGSSDTVAALLHSAIESSCTIVCPLCVTGRPALYYHRLAVSMSCMHLMHCLLYVPGVVMMSLMSASWERTSTPQR